ncbi:MAG TPA: ferredoxin family protein [Trebonia sp.]|jgi:NAD-dependent dihydropyrimidine dehydrogenase PreA subunit
MIELVSTERCVKCDVCIKVCPTNVFDHGEDRLPVIRHQEDCQTCFMCEAWCPADALFVAPQTTPVTPGSPYRDEQWLTERGLLGSYRRELGWGKGRNGRKAPEKEGLRTLAAQPLGLDHRRAAESDQPQYDIGVTIAYSDEGEELQVPTGPSVSQTSGTESRTRGKIA